MSSLQVVSESSKNKDHADGNGDFHGFIASGDADGNSSATHLKGPRKGSHGVAQVVIHPHVEFQGT
jgi:hypothetical protein